MTVLMAAILAPYNIIVGIVISLWFSLSIIFLITIKVPIKKAKLIKKIIYLGVKVMENIKLKWEVSSLDKKQSIIKDCLNCCYSGTPCYKSPCSECKNNK